MTGEAITDEELAEIVRRTQVATPASMRRDMDRYLALTRHGRGSTPREPHWRAARPLGGPGARAGGWARPRWDRSGGHLNSRGAGAAIS